MRRIKCNNIKHESRATTTEWKKEQSIWEENQMISQSIQYIIHLYCMTSFLLNSRIDNKITSASRVFFIERDNHGKEKAGSDGIHTLRARVTKRRWREEERREEREEATIETALECISRVYHCIVWFNETMDMVMLSKVQGVKDRKTMMEKKKKTPSVCRSQDKMRNFDAASTTKHPTHNEWRIKSGWLPCQASWLSVSLTRCLFYGVAPDSDMNHTLVGDEREILIARLFRI